MTEMRGKPTLCVDFDGVIHGYQSRWQGADVCNDPPVPGALQFLAAAVKDFKVCIYSSRTKEPGGVRAMFAWLHAHTMRAYEAGELTMQQRLAILDQVIFPEQKPGAFLTLDDRAVCFTGTFPDPKALLAFRTWQEGSPAATVTDEEFRTAWAAFQSGLKDVGQLSAEEALQRALRGVLARYPRPGSI